MGGRKMVVQLLTKLTQGSGVITYLTILPIEEVA